MKPVTLVAVDYPAVDRCRLVVRRGGRSPIPLHRHNKSHEIIFHLRSLMLALKRFLDDLTAEAVFVFNSLPQRFSPGETVKLILSNPPGKR